MFTEHHGLAPQATVSGSIVSPYCYK